MNGYYDPDGGYFYDGVHLSRLKEKFSKISFALLICTFVACAAAFLIQSIVSLLGLSSALDKNIYWQWVMSFLPLYLFGFPCAYLYLKKNTLAHTPSRKRMELGDLLILFLISRFFTLLGSSISSFLVSFVESFLKNPIVDHAGELIGETPWWLILIGGVIIGPIAEEIVYRKLIIDRLYEHGELVAVLFSSFVFALVHGNLYQVAYAFLNGCILGFVYVRSGKLKYSIALHMLTNFLGTIVVLPIQDALIRLESILEGAAITSELLSLSLLVNGYMIARLALAVIGAILLFVYYRRFSLKRFAPDPLPRGKALHIAFFNPGFAAFFFITVVEFLLNLY